MPDDALGRSRHGVRLRHRRGFLAGLEPPVACRDRHLAEQPRRDLAAPVGILIEVEDIRGGRASSGGRREQERGRQVAGGTRTGREGGGVDLHAGGDPDHRHGRPDCRADVAQRAVAARDEEQVRSQGRQLGRDPARVVGRRVRGVGQGPDHHGRGACGSRGALTHRPRGGQDLGSFAIRRPAREQLADGRLRALLRVRDRPQGERPAHDLRAVAALETDRAADAGHRVHDQRDAGPLAYRAGGHPVLGRGLARHAPVGCFRRYARQVTAQCAGSSSGAWSIRWIVLA